MNGLRAPGMGVLGKQRRAFLKQQPRGLESFHLNQRRNETIWRRQLMKQGLGCGCLPLPTTGLGQEPAPIESWKLPVPGAENLWKMLESRGWPLGQRENIRGL